MQSLFQLLAKVVDGAEVRVHCGPAKFFLGTGAAQKYVMELWVVWCINVVYVNMALLLESIVETDSVGSK